MQALTLDDLLDLSPVQSDLDRYSALTHLSESRDFRDTIPDIVADIKDRCTRPDGRLNEKKVLKEILTLQVEICSRIGQILADPDFQNHRIPSKKAFDKAPSDISKVIQQVFTAWPDRQTGVGADEVIISPSMITNATLKNLGLEEFIPPRGSRKEEKVEARGRAIPDIKRIMSEDLEPFVLNYDAGLKHNSPHSFRLFRIATGPNQGLVIGTQTEGRKRIFRTDIFSAYRRIDHIFADYECENAELESIKTFLKTTIRSVQTKWRHLKESDRLQKIIDEAMGFVKNLELVRDEDKVEIHDRLAKCNKFKDSSGKPNPGAQLGIWSPVLTFIANRQKKIHNTKRHLSEDQGLIWNKIQSDLTRLERFCYEVRKYADELKILQIDKPIDEKNRAKIIANLQDIREQSSNFEFQPYLKIGTIITDEIDKIIEILNNDPNKQQSRATARQSFIRVFSLAKVVQVQKEIANLRHRAFGPRQDMQYISVKAVMDELGEIRDNFFNRQIAKETNLNDKEMDELYKTIHTRIGQIIKLIVTFLHSKPKDNKQKQQIRATTLAQVNEALGAFSVLEIMNELQDQRRQMELDLPPPQNPPSSPATENTPPPQS